MTDDLRDSSSEVGATIDTQSTTERFRQSVGASSGVADRGAAHTGIQIFRKLLITSDIFLIIFSLLVGLALSARASMWEINPFLAIYGVPAALAAVWILLLAAQGTYDQRLIGSGTEELRRTLIATMSVFAILAGISYLIRADISRAYAFISLPLGLILILSNHLGWRVWLRRNRARGRFMSRTLIVGDSEGAQNLATRLADNPSSGFLVCAEQIGIPGNHAQRVEWLSGIDRTLSEHSIEAIAFISSSVDSVEALRDLSWHIEGKAVDLLIAPAMLDVAGPRLSVRPVAGLPLLHLDEVTLSRPQRFMKRSLDLVGSIICIVLLSPVLLVCAVSVAVTSRGPVLFIQKRIGRAGVPFRVLKFRTMVQRADESRTELRMASGQDAPTFKLRKDPRVTGFGGFLRKWSLDELPQLFNVLQGSMSLVGPRPHPMDDVKRYEIQAYRRLALKPGMTGLWQVEGRSDLTWEESLQLDLYYVENWSLATDLVILARTLSVVLQAKGSY